MRPYNLEKPPQSLEEPNKEVRTFPDWAGLQHEEQRHNPYPYPATVKGILTGHFRLWLLVGMLGAVLLVWWFWPDEVSRPATPAAARLGILYVSSKVQLPNSSVVAGMEGLVVTEVKAGSPASRAGIQSGDLLVRLGSHLVTAEDSLLTLLSEYKSGDVVYLEVVRNTSTLQFSITLN
jgi:membrane-associated protease RseP (regulator of RpoE activity)